MAFKFLPGDELRENGFRNIADVPFIVSDNMSYYSIENRFLRDVALGKWKIRVFHGDEHRSPFNKKSGVKISSVGSYAEDLTNFLSWCEEHDSYSGAVDIDDEGINEYGDDMEMGIWSQDAQPLAAATVIRRVSTAISCAEHAIKFELRPPYVFDTVETSYQYSTGKNTHAGETRRKASYDAVNRRRRGQPSQMILPSKREIKKFASSFDDPGKEIAARLILECGLRVSEPGRIKNNDILTVRQVENRFGHMNVVVPTKVIGKADVVRTVDVPADLIERIDEYRATDRKRLLGRTPTTAAQAALLLNQYGDPLTKSAITKAWNEVRTEMIGDDYAVADFSPHIGRHAFAVYWLISQIAADVRHHIGADGIITNMPVGNIDGYGRSHILELQNLLGHSRLSTTEKYLAMLPRHWRNEMAINRQIYLDDEVING